MKIEDIKTGQLVKLADYPVTAKFLGIVLNKNDDNTAKVYWTDIDDGTFSFVGPNCKPSSINLISDVK